MSMAVICIADSLPRASTIVQRLRQIGFIDSDISVLYSDKTGPRDLVHEKNSKGPEGTAAGAAAGGAVGGVLGLLAGIGAIAIPGVGPLIAAGPIVGALSAGAVGAAVGGVAGGLIGLGIPEFEARQYSGKVAAGGVLLSIHAEDAEEARQAKRVLRECGGQDISTTSEHAPSRVEDERRIA